MECPTVPAFSIILSLIPITLSNLLFVHLKCFLYAFSNGIKDYIFGTFCRMANCDLCASTHFIHVKSMLLNISLIFCTADYDFTISPVIMLSFMWFMNCSLRHLSFSLKFNSATFSLNITTYFLLFYYYIFAACNAVKTGLSHVVVWIFMENFE